MIRPTKPDVDVLTKEGVRLEIDKVIHQPDVIEIYLSSDVYTEADVDQAYNDGYEDGMTN